MKFEITYSNGSTLTVEIENKAILAYLDAQAKQKAATQAEKIEVARGTPTSARII